ncbi:hypothetical protein CPAR01_03177 [Colletotrichum paranaense]|uniref:Uncharacterized protein n=1 Tax=Colletotrichum paranaense TaxID=1914294 RepID=A0ABQ9T261_9PEZI|nr:uncharacterized protein CPAR01_03177 [Colletotrichum paranaense]KAK1545675.1 hypothetical protein CPAR01_03177 [Colletotrichum paranaense]
MSDGHVREGEIQIIRVHLIELDCRYSWPLCFRQSGNDIRLRFGFSTPHYVLRRRSSHPEPVRIGLIIRQTIKQTRRTQSGRVSARLLLVGVRGSCSCTSICIRSRNRSLDPAKGHKAETASMLAPSLGGKQRYAVISLSPESFRASVALLHRAWSWLDTPTSARLILERRWMYAFFPSARRTDG